MDKKFKMAASRDQNGRRRASKWDNPAPTTGSAAEAAREAARKLNAMLAAKGKLTINPTPPLLPPKPKATVGRSSSSATTASVFTEEVEINDSPRRLLLCQGNVQHEINKYSGATISTKGQYIASFEKGNMTGQRPLCLFIQAASRDSVNLAVQRIRGIIQGDDPFISPPVPPQQMIQSSQVSTLPSGLYYVQEKVFVGLDNVPPEFNLKEKILGPEESYFNHIIKETGAKVQLRGKGSGFIEPTSGREAFEALYVYISHNNYAGLGTAKKLVENLIQTVHNAYQTFQMQQTSSTYYPNYAGYPGQNASIPPARPPHMYNMPPVSGYSPPPQSNGPPPPYPPYPYPSHNHPPPHYNQPAQPGPNHNILANPQMSPPLAMYPHQALRHEGPRPLMSYRHLQPPNPAQEQKAATPQPDSSTSSISEHSGSNDEVKSKREEQESVEAPKPAKRRFTEAPAKKSAPPLQDSLATGKRSVSSLDQQPTQSNTPGGDIERSTMAPPVLPAPKIKVPVPVSDGKLKKDTSSLLDGFKMPLMPVSAVISAAKKNVSDGASPSSQAAPKKRKMDDAAEQNSEAKSTGIALLGHYDDSSDED